MEKETDNKRLLQNTFVVWLLAMVCCLLWGSAFASIKTGYRLFEIASDDTAAIILFAGCRFALSGVLAVIIACVMRRGFIHPVRGNIGKVICLSVFQTIIQYMFFYIGLANISGVKASIVSSVSAFISILIACLIFRQEKLTVMKIAGCVLGFAGVVLVNMSGVNFEMHLTGEGFMIISAASNAVAAVLIKNFSAGDDPLMLNGYQFIAGGVIMAAAGVAMGGRITVVTPGGIAIFLYLAMVSAVAYSLWSILLKYNPVSRVAVFSFMTPVFGVILSALILHETDQASGWASILALILVCIGIYIVNRRQVPAGENDTQGELL